MITRHAAGRTTAALLLSVGLVACGQDSGTGPGGAFGGTWEEASGGLIYVDIASELIRFYVEWDDCFLAFRFEVLSRSGSRYVLRQQGSVDTQSIDLDRSGEQLRISGDGETLVLSRSAVDVDQLELCDAGPAG